MKRDAETTKGGNARGGAKVVVTFLVKAVTGSFVCTGESLDDSLFSLAGKPGDRGVGLDGRRYLLLASLPDLPLCQSYLGRLLVWHVLHLLLLHQTARLRRP